MKKQFKPILTIEAQEILSEVYKNLRQEGKELEKDK